MNATPLRPFDFRKLFILFFAGLFFVTLLAGLARCDEVSAARERLQAKETERQEAAKIAHARAKAELEAQQAAVVAATEQRIEPVPDPISVKAEPTVEFSAVTSAAPSARLPRAVMIVSQYCEPCNRIKTEVPDLIGGEEAPIQVVSNWLANDLESWGIMPSMRIATPTIFILDKDGKVHGLTANGLGCTLTGYQNRQTIEAYLKHKDHNVSFARVEPSPVVATVSNADISPEMFAGVMAAHLVQAAGQPETEERPFLFGSLFEIDVNVPESWKLSAAKLLSAQTLRFPTAGITVDWSGPSRTFAIAPDKLTISPPVKVMLNKWLISYSAALDGIHYASDLSTVTFLLTGAPDLTVNLK